MFIPLITTHVILYVLNDISKEKNVNVLYLQKEWMFIMIEIVLALQVGEC